MQRRQGKPLDDRDRGGERRGQVNDSHPSEEGSPLPLLPVVLAMAEEVDIPGRPMQFACPNPEEHGALEYESAVLGGPREPIEQPLNCVLHQDRVEVGLAIACDGVQAAMHGDWVARRRAVSHASDSR
jgi:hypothetical protein